MSLPISFYTEYSLTVDEVASLVASTAVLDDEDCGCSGSFDADAPATERPSEIVKWAGVIGIESELTGDGRFIQPEALRWEALPIPLRYVSQDVGAHAGAQVVGKIETIERIDLAEANKRLEAM